jgi:hypothetical protein
VCVGSRPDVPPVENHRSLAKSGRSVVAAEVMMHEHISMTVNVPKSLRRCTCLPKL